jgi:hypothetical protein
MILSNQELHALTDYARPCKQIEALKAMGIAHKVYDGRPIVLDEHVKAWVEGRNVAFGVFNRSLIK